MTAAQTPEPDTAAETATERRATTETAAPDPARGPTTAGQVAVGAADGAGPDVPDTHGTMPAEHPDDDVKPLATGPRGTGRVVASRMLSRWSGDRPDTGLSLADRAVDHELGMLAATFRFLLDVTPTNVETARRAFLERDEIEPFEYRRLEDDPDVLRQVLYDIPVQAVEDPVLGTLLRNKQRELDLQLEMLQARDTADFMPLSITLYGAITPALRETAKHILASVPVPEPGGEDALTAQEFLGLAQEEIERYRDQDADIEAHAEIRRDVSGVMVSGDTLLVGPESRVQRARADALLQHEVGTHLVTHVNGSAQPIACLATGLAGYDETQEGLAVLAEAASGQLTPFRLRQLAARVLTVHRMVAGADFHECHRALVEDGIPPSSAFTTVMRAFRSGGMTKDAVYLRGVLDLVDHVQRGHGLELFLLGKFALADLPLLEDLHRRRILRQARIHARWLTEEACLSRVRALHDIVDPAQLVSA
ncbi:flavohemoglobin expression-modulating QEGLA motif protein [Micrococcus luteus]|uniref:flavohemoglobin expression-modulating QEGLA motif protein n=1 Tax=Micrococcus luteus TaxID=1270 RepID=UPI00200564C6|nr:flavohemoglobin expression-modulating QEGLA motif protein [Micrococcus luteus]MCK6061040.1 flavohemoglobin expression-modulating QEGLA motif protein [Micrococcus luteus]MCK6063067.1 flavohemoglobin expression-modulating QEGLA motif protein [Micrococcus luteus]MCK6191362.1 flavohemoglobin expression-modulating QEGLA motif protein [Micrococcus luteus]MCK6194029.1 flavohemoglobin expression-modulating QEGLA motif protein [Micrococcus luteus]